MATFTQKELQARRKMQLQKKQSGIRASVNYTRPSAINIRRMQRAETLRRKRASHAASRPRMNAIPEGVNDGMMKNENNDEMINENNSNNTAPAPAPAAAAPAPAAAAPAPLVKKKWENMTNKEKEAVRQAQIKTAKAKAARTKRIAAKAQSTRAARLKKEKENAEVAAAQKAEKRLDQRIAREERAKKRYQHRVAEAQALRATGNAAGAAAMEDKIRRDIRKEEEKELGPVGIEDLLAALGL